MKKLFMTVMITSTIMILVMGVFGFIMYQKKKKIQVVEDAKAQQELDILTYGMEKISIAGERVIDLPITVEHPSITSVYFGEYTDSQIKNIQHKKKKNLYDFESPLWIWDAFGTNHLSLYTYFKTKQEAYVRYTIHVEDETIPDFTRSLCPGEEMKTTREHTYQIMGFVPGMTNYMIMELYDAKDQQITKKIYKIEVPALASKATKKLQVSSGRSEQLVSNGLYAIFGKKNIWLYDNSGVLRGEIPIQKRGAQNIILEEGKLYYSIDPQTVVSVDAQGSVSQCYGLGKYRLYDKFMYNGYGQLWMLVTEQGKKNKSVKDTVITLDLADKTVTALFSMDTLLPQMMKKAKKTNGKLDWIALTDLAQINSDEMVVSSAELSTMFKVVNVNSRKPRITYMIGRKEIWKKTDYRKKLLKLTANEEDQKKNEEDEKTRILKMESVEQDSYPPFGETWLEKATDDTLAEGQYYLKVWDSNYAESTSRPDIKWSNFNGVGNQKNKARFSYLKTYLVDENAGTYTLMDKVKLTYTKKGGAALFYTDNHRIDTNGANGTYGEFDQNGKLIRKFTYDLDGVTMVTKLSFKQFVFQ